MPVFELQHDGKGYEVDAPDMATAAASIGGLNAPSAGMSFLGGVASGATMGFDDEYAGLHEAALAGMPAFVRGMADHGAPDNIRPAIAGGIGAGRLLYDRLFGSGDQGAATQAYQKTRDMVRAGNAAAQAAHPLAFGAGDLAGTAATLPIAPEIGALKGAGMIGRALESALVGGGFGAVSGAGEGEGLPDTVNKAATGLVGGGLLGAAAPPVLAGLGAAGRFLAAPFRGAVNPERVAQSKISTAFTQDAGGAPGAVSDAADRLADARATGMPFVAADTGGNTTRQLARSAANLSPVARDEFDRTVTPRVQGQADRIGGAVQDMLGGNVDSVEARDALRQAADESNRRAYDLANNEGNTEVWSPELARLARAPDVQQAILSGGRYEGNASILAGAKGPRLNPIVQDAKGKLTFREFPNSTAVPDIAFWDGVKKRLGDREQTLLRSGKDQAAKQTGDLRRQLVQELDAQVPAYRAARQGAAGFFGADDAMEAGEKFVTSRMENSEARKAIAAMTPAEREAFRYGFASHFVKQVREIPERSDVLNRAFISSPAAKERIGMALGSDNAARLEALLRLEGVMQKTSRAISGNSSTVQQLAGLGLAGGIGGTASALSTGDYNPLSSHNLAAAGMGALLKHGRSRISANVAQHVGRILASEDPEVLRQAVHMTARNPRLMNLVRQADNVLARAGGAVSPNLLPASAASRADQQQQQ